ncbi:MAG: Rieske 2Fe-2S domain-containing protein [Chloroflexota bacterium]|nr:Rieske 2Fe-2S domain-containing protein [Chloroflexota bacterium]
MSSISAGETRAAVVPRQKSAADQVQVAAPSRREFLYHIWGASIVLLLGQTTAGIIWFALPIFKEGTFGGVFAFPPDKLPQQGVIPVSVPEGRFHLSYAPEGVVVLYGVCTHLGCLPKWSDSNGRFECPCHGSKFELNGKYIEGPAPRSLDRFRTTVTFEDGSTAITNENGDPIPLDGRGAVVAILIDTGDKLRRSGKV